jgi:CheY-like chemotaxis protein
MDGYEATRRIRLAESETMNDERGTMKEEAIEIAGVSDVHRSSFIVHRSKIVALTTAAFAHEREDAIANGADDFRIKPLSEGDVFAAVAEHLGVRYAYGEPASSGPDGAATPERLAALPDGVLAQLSRALTIGDYRLAREIIVWIESHDHELGRGLDRMIRSFRFDELSRLIESIPPEGR